MLNSKKLEQDIINIFKQQYQYNIVSVKVAQAYEDYARTGSGSQGDPIIFKGTEKLFLKQAMDLIYIGKILQPAAAQYIAQAITSFWLLPPLITGTGGVVSAILPIPGAIKFMAIQAKTVEEAGRGFANALDLMTKTVFFVYPFPVPPGPIL